MVSGKDGFVNLHQPNLVINVSFALHEMGLAGLENESRNTGF